MSNSAFAVVTPTKDVKENVIPGEKLMEKMFPAGVELTPKQLKKKAKIEKAFEKMGDRIDKINAKRAKKGKAGVDFSDPVKKWMWFWIFGWAAGLLLSIVAGIIAAGSVTTGNISGLGGAGVVWLLASLCWLFGTVSGIIWLIKMLA